MYLDFYHLKANPFPISSDLKFFFQSSGQKKALTVLTHGVSQRNGLMTVLGDFGLGKSTLIQAFLKEDNPGTNKTILLLNSHISYGELLLILCRELGLSVEREGQSGLLFRLLQGLKRAYESGINVVLLIDEAHNMPEEALEGLRMISNQEVSSKKTLQIVFFGQPVFWEKLSHHDLRQLRQRIGMIVTLSPLTPAESREYIKLHIERAGGRVDDIFTQGALAAIVRQSFGNPFKINILSSKVLNRGFEKASKPVSVKIVKEVIQGPQGPKRINYFPWVVASAGILMISLGWMALDRFPVEPSGRTLTVKIIEEHSASVVPVIDPKEEKKSKRLLASPSTRRNESDTLPILGKPLIMTVRVVKEGDNFFRMVLEVYGFSNQALLDFVRKYNPGIKDVNRIQIGKKIVFPEWKGGEKESG